MKSFRSELEICDIAEIPSESSWIVTEKGSATGEDRKKIVFSTEIECAILFSFILYWKFFILHILLLKWYQYQFNNTIIDHQLVSLNAFETNQLSRSGKLFKLHVIRGFTRISETAIFWYQWQQVSLLRLFERFVKNVFPQTVKKKSFTEIL